jgi:hypothetical protein
MNWDTVEVTLCGSASILAIFNELIVSDPRSGGLFVFTFIFLFGFTYCTGWWFSWFMSRIRENNSTSANSLNSTNL